MNEITINQLAVVLGFIYTIWLTYKILKRRYAGKNEKLGCLTVGYVYLIVSSISALAIGCVVSLSILLVTKIQTVSNGDKYQARVVSYSSYESRNSDDNGYTTMYTPTVHFTTSNGELVEYELDYSSSGKPTIGELYTVYYDEVRGRVTTFGLGAVTLILAFGAMIAILVYLFIGMVIYAMNWSMTRYKDIGVLIGLSVILPLIMILFDGALIYGLFNGDEKPIWVYVLLMFFIVALTMVIWVYLKNIYGDGLKNMGMNRKGVKKVDKVRFSNTSKHK